jgi:hypothetical protein
VTNRIDSWKPKGFRYDHATQTDAGMNSPLYVLGIEAAGKTLHRRAANLSPPNRFRDPFLLGQDTPPPEAGSPVLTEPEKHGEKLEKCLTGNFGRVT